MKKLVLKIDMADDGAKRKAMKTIAAFPGIDSISVDMKERKLTIIGTVDPTKVVSRLRRFWTTELVTVGPAKEPEKEEGKKDDGKKDEGGSKPADEAKKESADQEKNPAKKEGEEGGQVKNEGEAATAAAETNVEAAAAGGGDKKEEEKKVDPVLEMVRAYRAYNPHMTKHYYVQSMEENPNACVIC